MSLVDDGKKYMSQEQAVLWYSIGRHTLLGFCVFGMIFLIIALVAMFRLSKRSNNSIFGFIYILVAVSVPYLATVIPFCGTRETNANYPICRGIQLGVAVSLAFFMSFLTNFITLGLAYVLTKKRSPTIRLPLLCTFCAIIAITFGIFQLTLVEKKELEIKHGAPSTATYQLNVFLRIVAYIRFSLMAANMVGVFFIMLQLYRMNFIKFCHNNTGFVIPLLKRRRDNSTTSMSSRSESQSYPIFFLAKKLVWIPIAQVFGRVWFLSYWIYYGSTTANYIKTVQTNPNYVGQTIHVLLSLIMIPFSSIGWGLAFLNAQPGAWTEFRAVLVGLFCWFKKSSSLEHQQRDTSFIDSRPGTQASIDLRPSGSLSSRQSDMEMCGDWQETMTMRYTGHELDEIDFQKLSFSGRKSGNRDNLSIFSVDFVDPDQMQEHVLSLREASLSKKDFLSTLHSKKATPEMLDELEIDELLHLIDANASKAGAGDNVSHDNDRENTPNPIRGNDINEEL